MQDDGIRERHGMTVNGRGFILIERNQSMETPACAYDRTFTPAEARYLARKLYRLARRIEQRQAGDA